jgi:hypothetical protein
MHTQNTGTQASQLTLSRAMEIKNEQREKLCTDIGNSRQVPWTKLTVL